MMHTQVIRPARSSEMRTPKSQAFAHASLMAAPLLDKRRPGSSASSGKRSSRKSQRGGRSSVRQDSSPIIADMTISGKLTSADPARRAEMFRKQQAAMFRQTKSR